MRPPPRKAAQLVKACGLPPVMSSAAPRITDNVPSVVMNGLMRARATSRPLIRPAPAPVINAAAMPSRGQPVRVAVIAPSTAARPIVEPTERSMPPAMMTSASPSATIPTTEISRATLNRLRAVRKYGLVMLSATKTAISISPTVASRRSRTAAIPRRSRRLPERTGATALDSTIVMMGFDGIMVRWRPAPAAAAFPESALLNPFRTLPKGLPAFCSADLVSAYGTSDTPSIGLTRHSTSNDVILGL